MDDLISRADVEQTVEDNILCYTHSDRPIDQDPDTECHMAIRVALRMLRKDLRKLPSAESKRKKGRWYLERYVWFCDQCGKNPTKGMGYVQGPDELFDFCPNCGAAMRGGPDADS